ncbi:Glycosyltransferase involved in cell wall bisynthesis [Zobellia uliginosa]|uniref:Glycosyltransferase involved in cell wall bisynthesis n=1 Tax=Zobellia uliginosa TaxID=143224 RepID=A0ABY1KHP7_9FLAO|nr:glycosyltransferase [Zobellia uliginosa]SIS37102.1 Glycosyltransferase involved in cell wall bisynthesis [Zobellia uliginosa]
MKNICITINSLNRGGAEKQCLLLAKALRGNHNVTVVVLSDKPIHGPHISFIEKESIEHVFLPANIVLKSLSFIRFLRCNEIDIIFSFLPTDSIFSAILGKIVGVPYVIGGIRNSYLARAKFIGLKWANNFILDYTIANNFAAYRAALKFGFKKKVFVISNGIELKLVPNREKKESVIKVISLGRLVEQKRYDVALKCIARLKKNLGDTDKSISYTIVGQGPGEEIIRTEIKKQNLEQEVELITEPKDIFELLLSADIYLCTSSFEGVSNAIMEAMNCSLPIVTTDAGDNERLVLHGKNGFVAEVDDVEKLSNYLKELVLSPSLRSKMGKSSLEHLTANFSYNTFRSNYLKLIDHIDNLEIKEGCMLVRNQTDACSKTV